MHLLIFNASASGWHSALFLTPAFINPGFLLIKTRPTIPVIACTHITAVFLLLV